MLKLKLITLLINIIFFQIFQLFLFLYLKTIYYKKYLIILLFLNYHL